MKTPQKNSNLFSWQLLILIAVVVVIGGLWKNRRVEAPPAAVSPSAPTVVDQAGVAVSPTPPEVVPSKSNLPDQSPASEASLPDKGLCRFASTPLLHWRAVKQILDKKPQLLILPAIHSVCLTDPHVFEVVDYDSSANVPFNHFGQFEVGLQRADRFESFQALFDVLKELGPTGFVDQVELRAWLEVLGGQPQEAVETFKVGTVKGFRVRNPVGAFSFFPGISLVEKADVDAQVKGGQFVQIFDFRGDVKTPPPYEKSQPVLFSVFGSDAPISSVLPQIASLASELSARPEARVLAIGTDERDTKPFYFASALLAKGLRQVTVLHGGIQGVNQPGVQTPTTFSGVSRVDLDGLTSLATGAMIADTRTPAERNSTEMLRRAVLIPINFRAFGLSNLHADLAGLAAGNGLPERYDLSNKGFYKQQLQRMANKKVILIGRDEFDWSPLIAAEMLKKTPGVSIYWLREGFKAIEIARKVGVDFEGLDRRLYHRKAMVPKMVIRNGPHGEKLKTWTMRPNEKWVRRQQRKIERMKARMKEVRETSLVQAKKSPKTPSVPSVASVPK